MTMEATEVDLEADAFAKLAALTNLPTANGAAIAGQRTQQQIRYRPKMAKRNSELLNSLLGVPKNILRSG